MLAENPVSLIQQGAPRRIHNEHELEEYTDALFVLTAKGKTTRAERETIELLTLLIEDYESRYAIPKATPQDVLKYMMEKAGLRQQDLQPELGSVSNISMILAGKRSLTLANASALAARFHMDIRAFLPVPEAQPTRSSKRHGKSMKQTLSKYPTPSIARRTA
ncbi:type II toxin-antitoxin system HigA family antitoxin [Terriglobus sp. RCC_193]|uniref:helix-turn-helix domain-containing protein n=1 Tax=Terriglobus sp. RCC_193 TaxID=3239218 RepID=UPI003524A714